MVSDTTKTHLVFLAIYVTSLAITVSVCRSPGIKGDPGLPGLPGAPGLRGRDGDAGKDCTASPNFVAGHTEMSSASVNKLAVDEFASNSDSTFYGGILVHEFSKFRKRVEIGELEVSKCIGCVPKTMCFNQSGCEVTCNRLNTFEAVGRSLFFKDNQASSSIQNARIDLNAHTIDVTSSGYVSFNTNNIIFSNYTKVTGELVFDKLITTSRSRPKPAEGVPISPPIDPPIDAKSILDRIDIWYDQKDKMYRFDLSGMTTEEMGILFPYFDRSAFDVIQVLALIIKHLKSLGL
jgi:hypothetical protein